MTAKKKELGPLSVRPEATDDGEVKFVVGNVVAVEEFEEGQTEHEFKEKDSFTLDVGAALALAEAIPNAAQEASARRAPLGAPDGVSAHRGDGVTADGN